MLGNEHPKIPVRLPGRILRAIVGVVWASPKSYALRRTVGRKRVKQPLLLAEQQPVQRTTQREKHLQRKVLPLAQYKIARQQSKPLMSWKHYLVHPLTSQTVEALVKTGKKTVTFESLRHGRQQHKIQLPKTWQLRVRPYQPSQSLFYPWACLRITRKRTEILKGLGNLQEARLQVYDAAWWWRPLLLP